MNILSVQPAALAAGALFDVPVAFGVADPCAPASPLYPQEARAIGQARRKRRREFAAGRAAARGAMVALGLSPTEVPMGPDRAPVWPQGICGSISHTETQCLAVVGRRADVRALGLDIEPATPLDPALWSEVCTPTELDALLTRPTGEWGVLARAVFCVKEAAYKAQYPISRTLFGFEMLETRIASGAFTARFVGSVPGFPAGTELRGRLIRQGGVFLAGVAV